ncbi:IS701 family transposase [Streptomyces sp. NPDC096142]|uniref:IS701 family transposase n=1 Tax=Streptomyces sp. NPDC096142 TaxID=3366077 RepID=UPI003813EB38
MPRRRYRRGVGRSRGAIWLRPALWTQKKRGLLRDFTRRYVIAGLKDGGRGPWPGGSGALVIDETGFAKKGRASAGVAPQYSGALGGVFPCQVGVMAAWVTTAGQASIDRELYLPKAWTEDRTRCRAAHVPERVAFTVKPRQAEAMISRIVPDLPKDQVWGAADEVYGRDGAFRAFLEEHALPYVVAVQANQTVLPRPGRRHLGRVVERCAKEEDWIEVPAADPAARSFQWWVRRIPDPDMEAGADDQARWLLARRHPDDPEQHEYHLGWGPAKAGVEELIAVTSARWGVEVAIRLAKQAAGMADYEVRSLHGWYRHISLAQLAAAFLAVQAAEDAQEDAGGPPAERVGSDAGADGVSGPREPL